MRDNQRAPTGDEGIRLAKRVAADTGCSRREAELLIENGAVRVDGKRIEVPESRVLAASRSRSTRTPDPSRCRS